MRNVATQFTASHGRLLLAVALDPKTVGQRIAAARERKGWTQLEFATEHAHVSPSSVARWEAGKLPPVRELMRIAEVLDVSAETLVEPAATPGEGAAAGSAAQMFEQVLDELRRLQAGQAAIGARLDKLEAPRPARARRRAADA